MAPLLFIIIAIAFLVGFLALTDYETQRGARFFAARRAHLDKMVDRTEFIIENVNLGEFARDEVRHAASRIGHDIAHLSLVAVRAVERVLTNLVRRLRTHHEIDTAPRETAREFVKTLSDFKGGLNATHPEISDIKSE